MDERINKYLSSCGYCSRREADRLINDNRVMIDGKPAQLGSRVTDGQIVTVDGNRVFAEEEIILLAFNKPVGILCTTTDNQGSNNIVDYIGYDKRIYPVGRLDKDSEGLILLTNQGQLMDDILRSVNGHEKEYIVSVNKPQPMYIKELDRFTRECTVKVTGDNSFNIVLTQGLNRQIRRMCQILGYKVVKLQRIRIMNILLGDLQTGQYRPVTRNEYDELLSQLNRD